MQTGNPYYPRWITTRDGNKMIVNDPQQHEAFTGIAWNEDATPKVAPPPPVPVEEHQQPGEPDAAPVPNRRGRLKKDAAPPPPELDPLGVFRKE